MLLPYGCGLTLLLSCGCRFVVSPPYGCGLASNVATYGCGLAVRLPYACGMVSSVATVRLRVGSSVATVRLRVGSEAAIRLRHGEQCCYRTVAGWQ